MDATEPFPFVPAIWIAFSFFSGFPIAFNKVLIFLREYFIPDRSRLKRKLIHFFVIFELIHLLTKLIKTFIIYLVKI